MLSTPEALFSSVYDYHGYFKKCLIVQLTLRCPLRCEHCIVDASPDNHNEMTTAQAVNLVKEVAQEGNVEVLVLTGGEPFINLSRLRTVLAVAQGYNLKVAMVTSAGWATSYSQARKILESLPSVANLSFSVDKYHLDFVKLDRVKSAIEAALSLNIEVGAFLCLENDSDQFLASFKEFLGDALYSQIKIITQYVHLTGRALESPHLAQQIERVSLEELPNIDCPTVSAPIAMIDGSVMACCGDTISDAHNWSALKLGNLKEEDLTTILTRAEDNLLVHALRLWGPKKLAMIVMGELGFNVFNDSYETHNICHICRAVVTNEEVVEALQNYLHKPEIKEQIILGRLLKFGESSFATN
ncbi:MAG: radical SAM protein [Cyanobacterium sp.]